MLIDDIAAEYVLPGILAEELKERAYTLLVAGYDNPNLAALVGATKDQAPADLRDLFLRALRDLGVPLPDELSAGQRLKRRYAQMVVDRELAPAEGAWKIVALFHRLEGQLPENVRCVGDGFGVGHLVGAYYSYDDVEGDETAVREIDEEIVLLGERIARGEEANPPE
ncbi:MAG TPA: hypothetical protein VGI39_34995 [Polyangiaceae bacterium]|jgi:hypothetical protein